MSQHSAIALLGILQQYGLSIEVLELWISHCERQQTGELALLITQGRITSYRATICGKVRALREEHLTEV